MEMQERKADIETKPPPTVDFIQRIIGPFGKYQLLLCLLMFLAKIPIALHQMAIIFLNPKVTYTCPDTNTESCPCPNPVYNTDLFSNTISMQWHLICGTKWLGNFNQTMFQTGTLFGSVLFGMASDRFGRRLPLLFAVVLQVSSGILAVYMPDYWTFSVMRLLVGASVGGTMVTTFVIVMEFVGSQYRDVVSALYQTPFNLGHMLLPVFGYFFRDYADFQLAISLPTILLLSYFFLAPETPRWLIAAKKTNEAAAILKRAAELNKRPTDNIQAEVEAYQAAAMQHDLKKGTLIDLFRTPNLRKNIICMAFNWASCSYCFYGVSQYVGQLSGNVFNNVFISALVTLFGSILSIPLMRLLGRKTIVIIFNFVCGVCLLVLTFIPSGPARVFCACTGVVSSFIVFVLVYLYCSELFPTVVRNAAVGFCSMMARVGSLLAPFVIGLQDVAEWLPPFVFAVLPLVAGCVTFLLPETKGCELMTTLEEGEDFGKKTNIANPITKPQ